MSYFFTPMFKLLGKFGDQCILKRSLFGHFLLEFAIELAKREGNRGEIRFQGREKPLYGKIIQGFIGAMPKQVADLMEAKFHSASVEIGLVETKLKTWWRRNRKIGIIKHKN
jgi:hypothetical protein